MDMTFYQWASIVVPVLLLVGTAWFHLSTTHAVMQNDIANLKEARKNDRNEVKEALESIKGDYKEISEKLTHILVDMQNKEDKQ